MSNEDCRDCNQALAERDNAQEWADELANLIALITGADIGEHSNLNNPWERAAEAADAYLKQHSEQSQPDGHKPCCV